ncbi:uncharacterized [Tachysurus ichikawai]
MRRPTPVEQGEVSTVVLSTDLADKIIPACNKHVVNVLFIRPSAQPCRVLWCSYTTGLLVILNVVTPHTSMNPVKQFPFTLVGLCCGDQRLYWTTSITSFTGPHWSTTDPTGSSGTAPQQVLVLLHHRPYLV